MIKTIKANQYECAICHGVFNYGQTEEEANAEAKEIWGVDNASERKDFMVICDDCFKRRSPEEVKAMGDDFKRKSCPHN